MRHLNASKEALFRKVCSFDQKEETMEVEIALQWNTGFYESDPLVRQRHLDHRRRHARGGVQEGPDQRGQQVRPGEGQR